MEKVSHVFEDEELEEIIVYFERLNKPSLILKGIQNKINKRIQLQIFREIKCIEYQNITK